MDNSRATRKLILRSAAYRNTPINALASANMLKESPEPPPPSPRSFTGQSEPILRESGISWHQQYGQTPALAQACVSLRPRLPPRATRSLATPSMAYPQSKGVPENAETPKLLFASLRVF